MVFYADETMTTVYGESKYTGGRDGNASNWPGLNGRPPLEIPAGHFFFRWATDGSVRGSRKVPCAAFTVIPHVTVRRDWWIEISCCCELLRCPCRIFEWVSCRFGRRAASFSRGSSLMIGGELVGVGRLRYGASPGVVFEGEPGQVDGGSIAHRPFVWLLLVRVSQEGSN